MNTIKHSVDFAVVGGGMAGLAAAIAAARKGIKTILIQDRPVLGGNASSEIRMWICGARGRNNKETGILEEIELENLYRNNTPNYSIWDSILYEKARFQENLTLLLNCTCNDLMAKNNCIQTIKAWQMTTQTWHIIEAQYFADCSGDSILAPLCNAEFMLGREGQNQYNESIAPENRDKKTMGLSCLIQLRETNEPQPFIAPKWAYKYTADEDLPFREHNLTTNFWWIELGGEQDTIHDTEAIRDELLKVAFGVWDHMKNYGDHGVENWVLDFVGFLPGRRESRRYVGDYVLTQNDIRAQKEFEDVVGYGGWPMDDHHPGGINYPGKPTIFHWAPSPFGIPYRCLYSKNISNLFFAGRNISVSHAALSSTRVMATCAILGQAVGTAVSIAVQHNLNPRQVYEQKMKVLQQALMEDDCYLPGLVREISPLSKEALLIGQDKDSADVLRDGYDRPRGKDEHLYTMELGKWVEYRFDSMKEIHGMRFIFDSNLNRDIPNMPCNYPLNTKFLSRKWNQEESEDKLNVYSPPKGLIKKFKILFQNENGTWKEETISNNYQRLIQLEYHIKAQAVRFIPIDTWGSEKAHLFSWDIR